MTFLTRYRWYVTTSIIIGIVGYIISYILFPLAFSILSINLSSSRDEVVEYAKELAKTEHFLSENFYNSVSFDVDNQAKTFIEREYGKDKLLLTMENNLYQPYQWRVRHFIPGTITEQFFFITPDKKAYGFFTKVPDSYSSKNISQKKAIKLAAKKAPAWNIDLENYILVAPSQQTLPSGRIDHTLIYERTDQALGEGTYRVKIIVSGDHVSAVRQYIQVPESFEKKYQEERSLNDFLANIALFFILLFLMLLGCGFGGFYLFKNNLLVSSLPLKIAIVAGVAAFLTQINSLPLLWMSYQTTQSIMSFYSLQLSIALASALQTFGIFFFVLLIAEGLTREAFKTHPQFWLSWTDNGSHDVTAQQTIVGYSTAGFLLNFVVLFYLCATRLFGWWVPVDTLVNPNMLATYIPCLFPIISALSAGIIEECLFRAIPLAGSALIGRLYKKEKLFLVIGFIFQILVFGAAHANYPSQPYYARLVELIIPSFTFGTIYLLFGLFPGIIAHALYDLILMSLPIFVSDAKNIVFQQAVVILCGLMPIIIICYHRFNGNSRKDATLNRDWTKPTVPATPTKQDQSSYHIMLSRKKVWICTIIFLASLIGTVFLMSRMGLPKDELLEKPLLTELSEKYALPFITNHSNNNNQYLQYRYIWQKSPELYQALMNEGFLHKPHWVVRYVQFHGSIADRTHEAYLFYKGQEMYRQKTIIPENKAIPCLDEEQALDLAYEKLKSAYGTSNEEVTLLEKNAHKQIARLDWNFIFEVNKKPHPDVSQRIVVTIAGNTITDYAQYIFIPEPWIRENAGQDALFYNFILILWIIFASIMLVGFYKAYQSIPLESIPWPTIIKGTGLLFLLGFLNFLNNFNAHFVNFLSIESIATQTIKLSLFTIIALIGQAAFYTIALCFCLRSWRPTYLFVATKPNGNGIWNTFKTNVIEMGIPFAAGAVFLVCLCLLAKVLTFKISPFIPDLSYQQAYFPSFFVLYQSFMLFLFFAVVFMLTDLSIAFVTQEWKRNYILGFLIACITGMIIALKVTLFSPTTVYSLGLYGILFGIGFTIMYHLIMRYDRYIFLIAAQLFTVIAVNMTLPLWYNWLAIYSASMLMSWCFDAINRQVEE